MAAIIAQYQQSAGGQGGDQSAQGQPQAGQYDQYSQYAQYQQYGQQSQGGTDQYTGYQQVKFLDLVFVLLGRELIIVDIIN